MFSQKTIAFEVKYRTTDKTTHVHHKQICICKREIAKQTNYSASIKFPIQFILILRIYILSLWSEQKKSLCSSHLLASRDPSPSSCCAMYNVHIIWYSYNMNAMGHACGRRTIAIIITRIVLEPVQICYDVRIFVPNGLTRQACMADAFYGRVYIILDEIYSLK